MMFKKVLVANRGEIAVRVISTLKQMGIASVAVYSDADEDSPHMRMADEAINIGAAPVQESYLNIGTILDVAKRKQVDAIHPGYGLLAENPEFVRACDDAGIAFIGPTAHAMSIMGSKIRSRQAMRDAGVPLIPGTTEPVSDFETAAALADEIGYPIAVKASAAGGGKGFRVANSSAELEQAIAGASSEGERFFGDGSVYLERYLTNPRHIEVQILADTHGNIVHLFERDCTVQRRHQKLVEEAPAPHVDDALRQRIGDIALKVAESVNYVSAGTVEGLLVGDEYFFLEMNTRIQVEHGITELITGVDLVEQQIKIAAGETLPFKQEDITISGHAIECRINAERASRNFLPSPGQITVFVPPKGERIRIDTGVEAGSVVSSHYDPLIAKVLVHAETRERATDLMQTALQSFEIEGISTLIPFHQKLLSTDEWNNAETCSNLIADRAWLRSIEDA